MEPDLQHIISSKRKLLARGDAPRPAVNYTEDMSSDQKDRFVEYLIEQNEDQKLTIRAMQAVLEDFRKEQEGTNKLLAEANAKVGQVLSQLEALQSELRQERKERKSLERKNARLQENWILPTRTASALNRRRSRIMFLQKMRILPTELRMRTTSMELQAVSLLR